METFQRDGGGGRRPATRDQVRDVIVRQEEIRICAVEDHDAYGVIGAQLGLKAIELAHQLEIKQIDRWMINGRPGDAVRDLDTKEIVTVVGHGPLLEPVVTISVTMSSSRGEDGYEGAPPPVRSAAADYACPCSRS